METIDINEGRDSLALNFKGIGVEVGVERAVFSKVICSKNPESKLYGIDPWKAYKGYRDHVTQEKLDGFFNEATERMKNFNCALVRKFSMDAVKDFMDDSLDFVFIDANHDYAHTFEDITEWAKKVKKGGIISGHDYIRRKNQELIYGVKDAVNDYVKQNNIPKLYIYRGDKSPSWMFYKI